jgi:hypothetical protein
MERPLEAIPDPESPTKTRLKREALEGEPQLRR